MRLGRELQESYSGNDLTTVLLVAVAVGDGYDAFVNFNAAVAAITIFAIGGSTGRLVYAVIMRFLQK